MLTRRFMLLTVAGVTVSADVSWIAVAPLLLWTLSEATMPALVPELSGTAYWGMALAATCGVVLSLMLRELTHIFVARRAGVPLDAVTLFIFGGVAAAPPGRVKAELKAAAAGLLASIALAVLFFAFFVLEAGPRMSLAALGVALFLMGFNGIVAAIGLLPAYPLSSGRVLRSALAHWIEDAGKATRIARAIAGAIASAILAAGAWIAASGGVLAGLWLMLLGLLIGAVALFDKRDRAAPQRP